ncbi:hypothetical protein QFC19_004130 [Naganishia cerealis]|uniref:Uncharacterized protein n=1 Tax=Naganishia cerealis TaxID=610337 RepID=A0ACC2VZB5_9TREE|nr:hypothetical protein QFC19_004130 [Naganishia cerealis]
MYILPSTLTSILFVISSYVANAVPQPVTSQPLSILDRPETIDAGSSNNTNVSVIPINTEKRVTGRPFGKQPQWLFGESNHEKRYWEVTSVWIVIETVTVTVDVVETIWEPPTATASVVSTLNPTTDVVQIPITPPPVQPPATSTTSIPSSTTAAAPLVSATPMKPGPENGKLVFAHFMVGVVSTYNHTDWQYDITLAKSYGIDGFALDIGKDDYTDAQLALAYQVAHDLGFKVFISFDFNWFRINETQPVIDLINKYISKPAQFVLPGTDAAYVSTFAGDGFDWAQVRQVTGKNLYVVANWQATENNAANSGVQGLFSWYAWPSENNKPVNKKMDIAADMTYLRVLDEQKEEKIYMAAVSPWFFTHFGKEVSYSKNWVFLSETLWYDRWQQILELQKDLQYIELVTWNE